MYFDHTGGGAHPPERPEAHIHAVYRKLFSLVKGMRHPSEIEEALLLTLQGLMGADGGGLCHIFDDGARFVVATGQVSHIKGAAFDLSSPRISNFLNGDCAVVKTRENVPPDVLQVVLNARFESMLVTPIVINGMPYGLMGLVSNTPNYFEARDCESIYEISRFLAMLFENRARELVSNERLHYERMGQMCMSVVPGLQTASSDLIQKFSQLRSSSVCLECPTLDWPLDEASASVEHMSRRVQDLRTLGEICLPPRRAFELIDVGELIGKVVSHERTAIEREATLRVTVAEDVPKVLGDMRLMWDSLVEVIRNAVRAVQLAPAGAHEIRIYAYRRPNTAVIEVEDTGAGIEPADSLKIYEPFFTTWPGCKGLGLAKAHNYALQMHGNIYYHRRANSTVFMLAFPDAQHAPQPEVF